MRKVSILGSTGSIGESALDVVRTSGGELTVSALCAKSRVDLLARQAREFNPEFVVIADEQKGDELRDLLADLPVTVAAGDEAVLEAATIGSADVVLCAMVGAAGILPAFHALESGKDLALANKETLVAAGEVIMAVARRKGRAILPVDSEHSALTQAIGGRARSELRTLYLTASGGPFWGDGDRDLREITPADALRHPSWTMGNKVTIDSATLMNKGLEVIEAHWLFDTPLDKIGVLVHPQSIVHGIVEFVDGSMLAHLSRPDMRLPIAAALYHPRTVELPWERLDLASAGRLDFFPPDGERFPSIDLARRAQAMGGTSPAVLNAANEVAVESFLAGRILFPDIVAVSARLLDQTPPETGAVTIDSILAADGRARQDAARVVAEFGGARRR